MTIKQMAAWLAVIAGIVANLAFQDSLAAERGDDWQLALLHSPSPALLQLEHAGRVTIYDGMVVAEVNRAMDDQFDRIGSMMFVRTKQPAENGSYVQDSDCD